MRSDLAMFGGRPAVRPAYRRLEWPVVTDADRAAVERVLDSRKFTVGAKNEAEIHGLEAEWAEFCDTRYAVSVNSGTVALELALAALGLQPGDEVIVPALSYVATAMAPLYSLAVPVFVDIDPVTFNIDVSRIEAKITNRTRAIVPVHLAGLPADMDEILALARKYDLFVVEDAVQAQGGLYRGRTCGSIGDVGVFSLNVEKSIPTCGEGGLVVTDREDVVESIRSMRILGEDLSTEERLYVSATRGSNLKLSSVLAAFTRSQLARFWDYQEKRDTNTPPFVDRLARLPGIVVPTVPEDRTHIGTCCASGSTRVPPGWTACRRAGSAPRCAARCSPRACRSPITRSSRCRDSPCSRSGARGRAGCRGRCPARTRSATTSPTTR